MTRNTELTRTALYRLALQRFGPDAQALKLTEEAAELAASAARNLNGQGSESDLAAELADVEIMTEQLRLQGMDRLIDFHKQKNWNALPHGWASHTPEKSYEPHRTDATTDAGRCCTAYSGTGRRKRIPAQEI